MPVDGSSERLTPPFLGLAPAGGQQRLQELVRLLMEKSLDRFTGSMVVHFQDGIALTVETRTKRRLKRSTS